MKKKKNELKLGFLFNSGPMLITLIFLLILNHGSKCEDNQPRIYHNHFALHIPGGSVEEDKVHLFAKDHGFRNLGQIGALEDHFLFIHDAVHHRNTEPSHHHHTLLNNATMVRWFEQQREHRRPKRDIHSERFVMPDPLFQRQWFLNHGAADGSDMNVQPAWKKGFTGKNVVVTILDDGIQLNHPDLMLNYDPKASTDINDDDDDPTPKDNNDNKHGTRCAGEVAAEAFNHFCGVGVAYNASIGGVRMLDGLVNDAVEAKALSLNPDHVDIYSASWGPEDDGKTVDGPGPLAKKAFINGVKFGRRGKGSIFVWASGNGGRKIDNCNCDGYTNSIFTLSISSATQGGRKPWYLEECSSTLASTYSSGTPNQDASITTVDQDAKLRPDKICTSTHTGTSASAPIAAGVCALALEANPNITWRDMQYIVVLTSNPKPLLLESGWRENAAGRKYSHKFGYGLMDATAMVDLARDWKGVGQQAICETETMTPDAAITANSVTRVSMNVIACRGTNKEINYLEHVQCKISLRFSPRGALHIVLTSPSGTKSSLLLPRPKDRVSSVFEDWPFLSVHFWGEMGNGTWTLEINPDPSVPLIGGQSSGILKKWKLFFYGTKESYQERLTSKGNIDLNKPQEALDPTKSNPLLPQGQHVVNASLVTSKQPLGPDGCSVECKEGCDLTKDGQCNKCKNFRFEKFCVSECPPKTFPTADQTCLACHQLCDSCFGPLPNQCLSCSRGFALISERSECVVKCPLGYRFQRETNECLSCPENCDTCSSLLLDTSSAIQKVICTSCKPGLVLHSEEDICMDSCPPRYFKNKTLNICQSCHEDCATCIGPLPSQCSICKEGTFFFERQCLEECPMGSRDNSQIHECVPCPPGCAECTEDHMCLSCMPEWQSDTVSGICRPSGNFGCPIGQYADEQDICQTCHSSCQSCEGRTLDNCLSCKGNQYLHISTCVDKCPASTFPVDDNECIHCPHACQECTGLHKCNKCQDGYALSSDGNSCHAGCDKSEHLVNGKCHPCHKFCQTCKGLDSNHCLSCPVGRVLSDGQCLEMCPIGYYAEKEFCLPCFSSCSSCFGGGHETCKSCQKGLKLVNDVCLSCETGTFYNLQSSMCEACHVACHTCDGPLSIDCTSCTKGLVLDPWNRTCVPCCSSIDEAGCCQCDGRLEKCSQPSRGSPARKRSFREDLGVHSSQSALLLLSCLTILIVAILFLLRVARKQKRRLLKNRRRSRRTDLYHRIPLKTLSEGSDEDDVILLNEEDERLHPLTS